MSLLGLDIGTTGCKAIAFNLNGKILASSYREYPLIHPKPGWAELDPDLVWENIVNAIRETANKTRQDPIKALAISSQGEAFMPVAKDGHVLGNAALAFDARGNKFVNWWEKKLGKRKVMEITGMPLSPIPSLNKMMWWKKHKPAMYKKIWKFLCFEDFCFLKMGLTPTMDYSMAARTMAFDIKSRYWSEKMLNVAGISPNMLAEVKPSGYIVGKVEGKYCEELGLPKRTIAVTGGHDQPCGALGIGTIKRGTAMDATGTVECICPVFNDQILNKEMAEYNFACYPHVIKEKYVTIAFNFTAGSLLKWFRDNLGREEVREAKRKGLDVYDRIIDKMSDNPTDIFVLPHFTSTGTPYLDTNSKGAILGLTLSTRRQDLIKALLEGVTFEMKLNLNYLEKAGININEIRAIGGGAKSRKWLQLKADIFEKPVISLDVSEAVCLGCSILAGTAIGEYNSIEDGVKQTVRIKEKFYPEVKKTRIYKKKFRIYTQIYPTIAQLNYSITKLRDLVNGE